MKKPILAIGPENGAVADLLNETNAGKIAHQNNLTKIKEIFLEYFFKWKNNENIYNPNIEQINKYERKNATKKLSEIFNQIIK